jgi:hypothetical protein
MVGPASRLGHQRSDACDRHEHGGVAGQGGSATPHANGSTASSLASQSFTLLNQYLAGNSGRVDPGQIVAAVSNGATGGQDSFLTRPQH